MNEYLSRTMQAAFHAKDPEPGVENEDNSLSNLFDVVNGEHPVLDVSALRAEIDSLPQNRFLNPVYWPKG